MNNSAAPARDKSHHQSCQRGAWQKSKSATNKDVQPGQIAFPDTVSDFGCNIDCNDADRDVIVIRTAHQETTRGSVVGGHSPSNADNRHRAGGL